MNKLTLNDFFCGAGGMGLGFKNAGFEIVGAWDFDKYAVESYWHNVGDHVKQMSILDMSGEDVPKADVWTFGFPCQDLSVAGKQAGMIKGQTRSGLFFEVMRLLGEVSDKPKIIMAENVKGLKNYIPILREEYEKAGYKLYYSLFNSKYWGVAQARERYFVLGVRSDIKTAFDFPVQDENVYIPPLSSVLEEKVDEKYFINKTVTIFDKPKGNVIGEINTDGVWMDHMRRVYDIKQVSPTVNTCQGGNLEPKILINGRLRKLVAAEFCRLQGFTDFVQVVSDSQVKKQMGNAVTVNVSYAIAKQIATFLQEQEPKKESNWLNRTYL